MSSLTMSADRLMNGPKIKRRNEDWLLWDLRSPKSSVFTPFVFGQASSLLSVPVLSCSVVLMTYRLIRRYIRSIFEEQSIGCGC